jgi:hypothetical protein
VETGSDEEVVKVRRWDGKLLLLLGVLLAISGYSYFQVRAFLTHDETRIRLKYLGAAMSLYALDFDDLLPLSENWASAIRPHIPVKNPDKILCDPFLSGESEQRGFGINVGMAGQHLSKLDYQTNQVLLAQTTTPGFSALVTPSTLRFCDTGDGYTWVLPTSTLPRRVKLVDAQKWEWKPVLKEK